MSDLGKVRSWLRLSVRGKAQILLDILVLLDVTATDQQGETSRIEDVSPRTVVPFGM
jgi:hypothetical protein